MNPQRWLHLLTVFGLVAGLAVGVPASYSAELVRETDREDVELIVYQAEDLTLVRETRRFELTEGNNRLILDWNREGIDPTSVRLDLPGEEYRVVETSYPADTRNRLEWEVKAEETGVITGTIEYLTMNLSWDARYELTVPSGRDMTGRLDGRITVRNRSGQTFGNARVHVLFGEIQLLRELAEVIREWERMREGEGQPEPTQEVERAQADARRLMQEAAAQPEVRRPEPTAGPPEESGDYYLMTLEERLRLPDGGTGEFVFLRQPDLEIDERYRSVLSPTGTATTRTIEFQNDESNQLGDVPLPPGGVDLYLTGSDARLSYLGSDSLAYLPRGETAELELPEAPGVRAEYVRNRRRFDGFDYDTRGVLVGWEEHREEQLILRNFRSRPVTVEVRRPFENEFWTLDDSTLTPSRTSARDIRYEVEVEPGERTVIQQAITVQEGTLR